MLGKTLWKNYDGAEALLHLGKLRPGLADFRITFLGGPTPGGYILGTLLTQGGQQLLENHCVHDFVK